MGDERARGPDAEGWPRRRALQLLTVLGGSTVFSRALVALAQDRPKVTDAMVRSAEWISGVAASGGGRRVTRGSLCSDRRNAWR